jgi:hypothetical protein
MNRLIQSSMIEEIQVQVKEVHVINYQVQDRD